MTARRVFLSAALAVMAAVVTVVPDAGLASPAAASAAQTRVGAHDSGMIFTVGPSRAVLAVQGRCESVSRVQFVVGACVAAEAAGAAPEGDLAGAAAGCGLSFTASTPVLTASGKAVAISKLRPGDKVIATDVKTGRTGAHAISAVLVNHDTDLFSLKVRADGRTSVIRTTWKHPFWDLTQHKWIKAGELRYGDHLRTASGGFATALGGTTPKQHDGWMWDLTVPGPHDFYVESGSAVVLTHNCAAGPPIAGGGPAHIAVTADVSSAPGTAFFWSGVDEPVATSIAQSMGGNTLEGLLPVRGINMPAWAGGLDPNVAEAWYTISARYAAAA